MSADSMTRPERAAQIRQAKRYRKAIDKRGLCSACVHRNREETFWGRSVCSIPGNRQHPTCERDGRMPKFQFDPTVLEEFQDAA